MRKLCAVMAAVLVLASATAASAIEIKVKGNWGYSVGILKNSYKYNLQTPETTLAARGRTQDPFFSTSRMRTQVDFIASKDLWGKLYFEIGKMDWGRPTDNKGGGAPLDADMVNIKIKNAFIDWRLPETDIRFRMGIQNIALPQSFGESPVFNDDVAGITMNWAVSKEVGITAFWARPFDYAWNDNNNSLRLTDEMDIFGLSVPIKLDSVSITPWAVVAPIGNDSGYWYYMYDETNGSAGRRGYGFDRQGRHFAKWWEERADDPSLSNPYGSGGTSVAWFLGTALKLNLFDPWTFKADFIYGRLNGAKQAPDTKGWFADAALSYKLDWGVPALFGWYSTGDSANKDSDAAQGGRLPILGLDTGFAISQFGFADGYGLRGDQAAFTSGVGLWGVGLEITKIKIWDKFSHDVRFIYARGTNNSESARYRLAESGNRFNGVDFHGFYLTHHDKYYEINFNHFYKIYENLTVGLELGMIHLDLDENVWGTPRTGENGSYKLSDTTTGWQTMLTWKYQF